MILVIDTNVLVSAIWKEESTCAQILSMIISGDIKVAYDYRIIDEYREVLMRKKFCFDESYVEMLINFIMKNGISVIAKDKDVEFTDASDRKFYEVAMMFDCKIITGNIKHFKNIKNAISPKEFLISQ